MDDATTWTPPPPRWKRQLPAGFIEPCRPGVTDRPPRGADWTQEVKYDGFRVIARLDVGRVRLWTRSGLDWTDRFNGIAAAVARLPVSSVMLDGEATAIDDNGLPRFWALRSAAGLRSAVLFTFDVLQLDGHDLRKLPLSDRRERLAELLQDAPPHLALVEHDEGDGAELLRHACRLGLEGIVSKRASSPYRSGPSRDWLKVRCEGYERR